MSKRIPTVNGSSDGSVNYGTFTIDNFNVGDIVETNHGTRFEVVSIDSNRRDPRGMVRNLKTGSLKRVHNGFFKGVTIVE